MKQLQSAAVGGLQNVRLGRWGLRGHSQFVTLSFLCAVSLGYRTSAPQEGCMPLARSS